MAEIVTEARIWTYTTDGSCPQKQTFNLADLMHKKDSCMVIGVDPLPQNQARFEQLDEFSRINYCVKHPSLFRAFKLVNQHGLPNYFPEGAITDRTYLALIAFDTREVTVLPWNILPVRPLARDLLSAIRSTSDLFATAYHNAARPLWTYDGNLVSALREFLSLQFSFNLGKFLTGEEAYQQGIPLFHTQEANSSYGLTTVNVPFEQVAKIISEGQKL